MIKNKLTIPGVLFAMMLVASCIAQTKDGSEKSNAPIGSKRLEFRSQNPGDNIHDILQDRKGDLWFATTGDGVYCYNGESFRNYTVADGLNSNCIFSMLEDKNGNIWVGTGKGISRFDGKHFVSVPLLSENSMPMGAMVFCMHEERSGRLWFGTSMGVFRYHDKKFTSLFEIGNGVASDGFKLNLVNRILEDRHGNIWFTTKTEGVFRYDSVSIVKYTPDGETYWWSLLEERSGDIWVSSRDHGLWRYDGQSFSKLFHDKNFYIVFSQIQDSKGNIWFGAGTTDKTKGNTEGDLWRYDGKTLTNISKKHGFADVGICRVFEDKVGNIWMGTRNTGLYRFDGINFTAFSFQIK